MARISYCCPDTMTVAESRLRKSDRSCEPQLKNFLGKEAEVSHLELSESLTDDTCSDLLTESSIYQCCTTSK